MKKFLLLLICSIYLNANEIYFVSIKKGKDSNSGTLKRPFKTIKKAISVAKAGDTINIRAGVYPFGNRFNLNGAKNNPITFQAYRDEKVIFKGPYPKSKVYNINQNHAKGTFLVKGSYLIFKNFELQDGINGIYIKSNASHNIFENLSIHDNYYSSLIIADGAWDNKIINCDAYHNFDSNTHGENSDGFVVTAHRTDKTPYAGKGNIFINCRSWENGDDGFDCWNAGNPVTFINCISYDNGYDHWHKGGFKGNGNGFKLGIHNRYGHPQDAHVVINCKAWGNSSRGFDYNDNEVAMTLFRNISYNNKNSGFKFLKTNHNLIQNINIKSARNYLDNHVYQENNSWNNPSYPIEDDIISFDDSSIKAKRDKDGNINSNGFLELKPNSRFYDKKITQKYQDLMDLMLKFHKN
ncbi:MAG: DUF1565 domain-containing protein [Epsilonproteobacteria bacterium]|nr:DUF1565 domain-containing protein [Campylobacterota bacterium]